MIPGLEDPLEKGMATLSSILSWEIPWTEEPGVAKELDTTYQLNSNDNQQVEHLRIPISAKFWIYRLGLPIPFGAEAMCGLQMTTERRRSMTHDTF